MGGAGIRGIVWIVVGGGVYAYSLATHTPIVIRGTHVPWGLVVVGVGAIILAWDLLRAKRAKKPF